MDYIRSYGYVGVLEGFHRVHRGLRMQSLGTLPQYEFVLTSEHRSYK